MGCYKFLITGKLMLSLPLPNMGTQQHWKGKVSPLCGFLGSHMALGTPNLEITKNS